MSVQKGVLTSEYHNGRKKKRALKYRLARRTDEVLRVIKTYKNDICSIYLLDLGTADGLMLDRLCQDLNIQTRVGLDFSAELLKTNPHHTSHFIQAEAMELPFDDGVFDVVVATAVIEHVSEPEKMVAECNRVLRQDGICIFTTPDPFFEHIATKIGHLKDEHHQKTFKLSELTPLFESEGFNLHSADIPQI